MASKAYDFKNAELGDSGLEIRTPETITDVSLNEVPLYLKSMNYVGVIKVPYSNAGQGVFTITRESELDDFMAWAATSIYDLFIVQALVGNASWSSTTKKGHVFYHVGTIPSVKNKTYVADVRMMICSTPAGYRPLAIYARRARTPLAESLDCGESWDMLGTNLSVAKADGTWDSDTGRLVLMDRKDFNKLGISIDDLVDGFIQTCLASSAIDQMCQRLLVNGKFDKELFSSLNKDPSFLDEILELEADDDAKAE